MISSRILFDNNKNKKIITRKGANVKGGTMRARLLLYMAAQPNYRDLTLNRISRETSMTKQQIGGARQATIIKDIFATWRIKKGVFKTNSKINTLGKY